MKNIPKTDIVDIAYWFLNKESMPLCKLQLLCWYAYSWYLYLTEKEKIKGTFIASSFGCMSIEIHKKFYPILKTKFKKNGDYLLSSYKPYKRYKLKCKKVVILRKDLVRFLSQIYKVYGCFDTTNLVDHNFSESILQRHEVYQQFHLWFDRDKVIHKEWIFEEYDRR